jgi:hypothetical protein
MTYKLYWGASIQGECYGGLNAGYGNPPWPYSSGDASWNEFESHAGRKVGLVACHLDFCTFDADPINHAYSRGAGTVLTTGLENGASISAINSGSWDSKIQAWAKQVAAFKKPFFLRPWWEMNGDWGTTSGYTWQTEYGTTPSEYVQAWQRLKRLADGQGATNISYIWCPNYWSNDSGSVPAPWAWDPGWQNFDWVGIDIYNKGSGSVPFDSLFSHTYQEVVAQHPHKPIIICETASEEFNGAKAGWITDTLGRIAAGDYPHLKGWMWYNCNNGSYQDGSNPQDSFAIESSASAQQAFAKGISNPAFISAPAGVWTSGKVPVP